MTRLPTLRSSQTLLRLVAVVCAALLSAGASATSPPCSITPVFAHRGHPEHVENSVAAVRAAMSDGFGGAEVDIQQLASPGSWALHHDLMPGRIVALPPDRPLRLLTVSEWRAARFVNGARADDGGPATLDAILAALPAHRPPDWRLIVEVKDFPSLDDLRMLVRQVERRLPLSNVTFSSLSEKTLGYLRVALPPGSSIAWILLDQKISSRALSAREWQLIETHGGQLGIKRADVRRVLDSGARVEANPQLIVEAAQLLGPRLSIILDVETIARAPALAAKAHSSGIPLILYASIGTGADLSRLLARLHHSRGFWPNALIAGTLPAELCREVNVHLRMLREEPVRAGDAVSAPAAATPAEPAAPPRKAPKPEPTGAPFQFKW